MCKLLRNIASSSSDDVHLNTRLNFPTSSRFNALKEIQFVPPDCVANASRLPQSSSPFGQLMLRLREEISCRLRYSFRLPSLEWHLSNFLIYANELSPVYEGCRIRLRLLFIFSFSAFHSRFLHILQPTILVSLLLVFNLTSSLAQVGGEDGQVGLQTGGKGKRRWWKGELQRKRKKKRGNDWGKGGSALGPNYLQGGTSPEWVSVGVQRGPALERFFTVVPGRSAEVELVRLSATRFVFPSASTEYISVISSPFSLSGTYSDLFLENNNFHGN